MVKKKKKTAKKKTVNKKANVQKKKTSFKKKLTKKNSVSKSSKISKTKILKKTKKTLAKKISKKSSIKQISDDKPKKVPKAISGFNDKIKEIFSKLINKHKVDGIYTQKIIEKAIPKKFRLEENIKKFQNLIASNNIKKGTFNKFYKDHKNKFD